MKALGLVAGVAAFVYMMWFSDAAMQVRAANLIDKGVTPPCDSPQAHDAALRVLHQTSPDARLGSFEEVSTRANQRRCGARYTSALQQSQSSTRFSLELDPPSRTLFVAFEPDPFLLGAGVR